MALLMVVTLVLIDLQWGCDPDIAFVVGESKCKKSIAYMLNNLKKIFNLYDSFISSTLLILQKIMLLKIAL